MLGFSFQTILYTPLLSVGAVPVYAREFVYCARASLCTARTRVCVLRARDRQLELELELEL